MGVLVYFNPQKSKQSGAKIELCTLQIEQWTTIILAMERTNNKTGTMNHTGNIPIFLSMNCNIILMYTLYILEWLFLAAPRECVHFGLVLGLDWAPCQSTSILYLPCLLWPTQQLVVCPNDS
jgi:hypothetical protein